MKQWLLLLALMFPCSSLSAQENTGSGKEVNAQTRYWREQRKKLEAEGWKPLYASDTGEISESVFGVSISVYIRRRNDAEKEEVDKADSATKELQDAPTKDADIAEDVPGTPGRPDIRLLADPESMELTILLDEVVYRNITILRGDTELFMSWVRGKETKLDISFLPPGIYTLRLEGFGGIEERNFVKR